MLGKFRSRLTYANVVATLALFFALGGGTAVALQGRNTVDSGDIINGQVKSGDVLDGTLTSTDVAFDSLHGDEIQDGSLGGNDVVPNSLGGNEIAEFSLGPVPDAQRLGSVPAADYQQRCREGTVHAYARVKGAAANFPSTGTTSDSAFIDTTFNCSTGWPVTARRNGVGDYFIDPQEGSGFDVPTLAVASVDPDSANGSGEDNFATVDPVSGGYKVIVRDADGGREDATFTFLAF